MKQDENLKWRSNVKSLFNEIRENGGHSVAIMNIPLRITYSILREAAQRAVELQDGKLIAIFARLSMYEEADQYSKLYDKEKTETLISEYF
jgi:hypothetical protein